MSDIRQTHEPHDRLTRLCKTMTDALQADPEYSDDIKCVVFLDDTERGGLQIHGYQGENADVEAIANLFLHLRAMFRARGQDLLLMPIGEG